MRSRRAFDFASVVLPRESALASIFSEYALPFSAAASSTSLSTTGIPAFAHTYAIPAPIMPAPRTPTFLISRFGMSLGRDAPEPMACRSKKNAWIMFFATCPVTSDVK